MRAYALLLAFLLAAVPSYADVHTAASCSSAHVSTQVTNFEADTDATVELVFPTCTSPATWTENVTIDVPATATTAIVRGAGSTSIVGGNDQTIIIDDLKRSGVGGLGDVATLQINLNTTADSTFEIYGITMQRGTDDPDWRSTQGVLRIAGSGGALFRVHHMHFEYTSQVQIGTHGQIYGVIDNNISDLASTFVRTHARNWGGENFGDGAWADDTNLGTNKFVFLEDNEINGGIDNGPSGVSDSYLGGRWVVRYNTFNNGDVQTHPTGGSGRDRGSRAWEVYGNDASSSSGKFNFAYISSGTGVIWGNDAGSAKFQNFITWHSIRRRPQENYQQIPLPDGWGYCGPAPQSGTVNTNGTAVTKTAGTNFDTNWPNLTTIIINDVSYTIDSVSSTTALTLTATAGSQSGVAYLMGSNADENATAINGYRCLDSPGNGKGDLLANDFPDIINETNGNADTTTSAFWARQAVEPIRVWDNTWSGSGGGAWNSVYDSGSLVENDNFYSDRSSLTTGAALTFDGTVGIGSGTRASRPATCTTGVTYWSTDQGGNWNTSAGNVDANDGTLDKCTATDTWTNAFYTPYAYPHPLRSASEPDPGPATGARGIGRTRGRTR